MKQTIGQRLKAAREQKHITLEKAFEATRIRIAYLQALEADDLSVMPSPVQARGYLRNYAAYLGLDFNQLLEEMRSSQSAAEEIVGPMDTSEQAPVTETTLPPQPKPDSVKQAEPPPEPSSVKPKRRGRKKSEPLLETQPQSAEEKIAPPEPVIAKIPEPQAETSSPPDVGENVWQAWLNRLGAILASRAAREGDVPNDLQPASETLSPNNAKLNNESLETQPQSSSARRGQNSAEIFKEIGATLRQQREMLSLHLEEVERAIHVKAHYLEALEQGAMHKLPSTVQTRGMLANYAAFLDLDVDAILLRFADALQALHREKNPQRPVRAPRQPIQPPTLSSRAFIAGDLIFGVGMAIVILGFAVWGINRVMTLQSLREIQPTAPSISDVLLVTPDPSQFTPTPTLPPVESFPSEPTATIIIPTLNPNVTVQVNLVAIERTYLRVVADEKVVFEGRTVPGNAYPFEAEEQIEVLVGSGAAIRIVYNGRDLGLLGEFGQVVHNIYRAEEIITPTALPTSTPLPTLTPTATVPPTSTPRPTNTPIPSQTPSP